MKRRKYQEEQAKESMVSVSRSAGPPHLGQAVWTKASDLESGDFPVPVGWKSFISGRSTGSLSSGTGTVPQAGQWTMGMGAPQ